MRYIGRHSETSAGAKRYEGRSFDGLSPANLQELVAGYVGQGPCHRFEVI